MKNHFWFSRLNIKRYKRKFDLVDLKNTSFVMDFETSTLGKVEEYRPVIITYALLAIKRKFVNYFNGNSKVYENEICNDILRDAFDSMIKIIKLKKSKSRRIDIWFNNSSKYDGEFIIDWLVESGFLQTFNKDIKEKEFKMVASSDIGYLQFEIKFKGYKFVVRDLLRFTTLSVDKLGKIVGLDKKNDIGKKYYDKDFLSLNQNEIDEYVDYAIRDIEVLWYGFKLFHKFVNLDTTKMTIPSYALKDWKERDIDKKKYLRIDSAFYNSFSYFGGYSNGNYRYKNKLVEGDIRCYDINSAYPFAMMQKLPIGLPMTIDEVEHKNLDVKNLKKLYYIRFKNGRVKKELIPIIRNYNVSNQFFMSVGNFFRYAVWEEELEWFKKYYDNLDYDIQEINYFECDYIFTRYVKYWYGVKEKSSEELFRIDNGEKLEFDRSYYEMKKYVSKLMMNSLYGKFGQKPIFPYYLLTRDEYQKNDIFSLRIKDPWIKYQRVRIEKVKAKDFPDYYNLYEVINLNESLQKQIPKKCNNVFIASYITMFVRCILFSIIYDLKERFLYSDTDSIYCLGEIDKSYLDMFELGKWKQERKDQYFKFLGSKCYISSKEKIVSNDKKVSKIVISGVNYYDTIIGKDIDEFKYGLQFFKNSSKTMSKGKMIYLTEHIIKEKKLDYE